MGSRSQRARTIGLLAFAGMVLAGTAIFSPVVAATVAPPMLDIPKQCESRHNTTAMSECIVAESEARTDILQKWAGYSDASAEKCLKLGRKARKLVYVAIDKCLAGEPVSPLPPPEPPKAEAAKSSGFSLGCAASYFFSSSKCGKDGS